MNNQISERVEKILITYTSGEFYHYLLRAKNEYFSLTGKFDEDQDDYLSRLNCFNDWYLFNYKIKEIKKTSVEHYLENTDVEAVLKDAILNFSYSIFEYVGKSFKNEYVLKDFINNKKIKLSPEHDEIGLFKGDIFTGRIIFIENTPVLLHGLCVVKNDVKRIIKKEAKKVRKISDLNVNHRFLLKCEFFINKWKQYNHLSAKKLFIFDDY